jgi:hypothetical protein
MPSSNKKRQPVQAPRGMWCPFSNYFLPCLFGLTMSWCYSGFWFCKCEQRQRRQDGREARGTPLLWRVLLLRATQLTVRRAWVPRQQEGGRLALWREVGAVAGSREPLGVKPVAAHTSHQAVLLGLAASGFYLAVRRQNSLACGAEDTAAASTSTDTNASTNHKH